MEDEKYSLTCMTVKEHKFISKLSIKSEKEFVRNPYTAKGCTLSPLQVAIYDYIKGCESLGSYGKNFETALGMFKKYWPKEYMVLLD